MIEVNRKGEVWVFAEQEDGALHDIALELCGKARELAELFQKNFQQYEDQTPAHVVAAGPQPDAVVRG